MVATYPDAFWSSRRPPAGRSFLDQRCSERQGVVVDEVEVGQRTRLHGAAVGHAVHNCCLACLLPHHVLERQPLAPAAVVLSSA